MSFLRNKEDFSCERCGLFVTGDGYTNHCPRCLFSKHVDISPGDRMAFCGGLMKPIRVEKVNGKEKIRHKCLTCGYEKINQLSKQDNYDKVIEVLANE